jgi:hypothetical protein
MMFVAEFESQIQIETREAAAPVVYRSAIVLVAPVLSQARAASHRVRPHHATSHHCNTNE